VSVIDVDTHWESTSYEPGEYPLAPWLDQIPAPMDALALAIAGDLLRALPSDRRPDARTLLPRLVARAEERGGPIILHPLHESSASERVGWMDHVGIDHCLVNPGGYFESVNYVDDRARAVSRCNNYLADQLSDHIDRLHPVALLDLSDIDMAVAELERARALGHRAFFLYTDNGGPPGGVSPGHPAFDPLWAAATSLGMLAVIHIGNTKANFAGWANVGWDEPGSAGIAGLVRLANTQRLHLAQNLIVALLYGGVFARHPKLTVMLEEMRVGWLPWFVKSCSRQSSSSPALGDWPWDVSGEEMLHRGLRVTPLPGSGDDDALDVVAQLPEMCSFSSDYPHQEGNAEPIVLYGDALDRLDPEVRDRFLSANIIDCFARMGDPLV
jgi:predicted TIM-barrel fold metal-dependent hydrolase